MTKKEKLKPMLNLIYSVLGLIVFNGIIQFVLYPFLNGKMGEDSFGVVLTLLSLISIVSGSFGTAVNNTRMVYPNEKLTANGDYNTILLIFNLVGMAVSTIFLICTDLFDVINVVFINILMFVTTFRFYADVEYRKKLNYFSFLIYYVLIGIGYCIGCLIYLVLPVWHLALLIGESLALLFILIRGDIFHKFLTCSSQKTKIWTLAVSLAIGELIANLILNSDRLLLYLFMDGTAVTTYYVASLVGKIVALVTVPLTGVIMGYLAKMEKQVTKKFYLIYFLADVVLGLCAFVGCMIFSPIIVKLLYPDLYSSVQPIMIYAIVGQVLFFCSNLLNILLLRFYPSKIQLILSIIHLIIFVACCLIGINVNGLLGFSIGTVIGNGIKILFIILILILIKGNNKISLKNNQQADI